MSTLSPRDLQVLREAMLTARAELEGLEAEVGWYVMTGPVLEQLDEALALLEACLPEDLE